MNPIRRVKPGAAVLLDGEGDRARRRRSCWRTSATAPARPSPCPVQDSWHVADARRHPGRGP
ncbi:MAG: hypothetical protein MZU95_01315 [Desulfomicrobium escambiense]|nr:hypothetical protein [Desulfomicrobium escambiense]